LVGETSSNVNHDNKLDLSKKLSTLRKEFDIMPKDTENGNVGGHSSNISNIGTNQNTTIFTTDKPILNNYVKERKEMQRLP